MGIRFGMAIAAALLLAPPALAQTSRPLGKLVQLNGIALHYQERGTGEPLLLLHGFGMCSKSDWGPIADELAKTYRVILPDLRGHGWSTNPSNKFTMRQSAEDIRALLDQLKLRRIRAMGISAGGMTLLHLATKYPDRISTMAVIGTAPRFPDNEARAFARQATVETMPKEIIDSYDQCATRGRGQVRDLIKQFAAFANSNDDMNFTTATLARIKARTLIVNGDRDFFFPVALPVELHAAIPNSSLWIVPGGGHVPIHGSDTPEFLRVTSAFLKRTATPANPDQ